MRSLSHWVTVRPRGWHVLGPPLKHLDRADLLTSGKLCHGLARRHPRLTLQHPSHTDLVAERGRTCRPRATPIATSNVRLSTSRSERITSRAGAVSANSATAPCTPLVHKPTPSQRIRTRDRRDRLAPQRRQSRHGHSGFMRNDELVTLGGPGGSPVAPSASQPARASMSVSPNIAPLNRPGLTEALERTLTSGPP